MNNITLGRYIPYNSFVHRLDPRAKLFALCVFMACIFIRFSSVPMNFIMYGVMAIIIICLMLTSHVSIRSLFKSLKSLWIMVLFLLIMNVLIVHNDVYGHIEIFKGFKIYYYAIYQTLYILIRLVLMLSLTMILTATTSPLDLTFAIEWIFTPLKVIKFPAHEIAMTISIALRFIPTLLDKTDRIMKAQASRGVDFVNGKLKEKFKAVIALIVPMFVSAFQISDELANAMEARGYDPKGKRTRYRILKWRWRDWGCLFVTSLLLGAFIYVSVAKIDFITIFASLF